MNPFAIDFETTGRDAKDAHPIEWAFAHANDGAYFGGDLIALPKGLTIPPETSAVHHIIDEDLKGARSWESTLRDMREEFEVDGSLDGLLLIAHNADYEQAILAGTEFGIGAGVRWVCTYKCALVQWPDAPSHSNEGLRYWLRLGTNRGRQGNQNPHSALHDAKVTAGIFNRLREEGMTIDQMLAISAGVAQLPTCPIGDFRGKRWNEVETGFLKWAVNKPVDREDVVVAARRELERRGVRA